MLCFDCAVRYMERSRKGAASSDGLAQVPTLIDGHCPVCGGHKPVHRESVVWLTENALREFSLQSFSGAQRV